MFTVKHVSHTGIETIYPATEAVFNPNDGSTQSLGFFHYTVPGTTEIRGIEGGTVYVMNETGKTVATYRMTPDLVSYVPFDNSVSSPQTHFMKPDGRIG
jgi:hypothetical protein